MTYDERKAQVKSFLGKTVEIEIDRPLGYEYHKQGYSLVYDVNYGYIPGVVGGDGRDLDVYLLGVHEPVERYTAKVIGIVHRRDDVEDKLVAAPEGKHYTKEAMEHKIYFQERYFDSYVEPLEDY